MEIHSYDGSLELLRNSIAMVGAKVWWPLVTPTAFPKCDIKPDIVLAMQRHLCCFDSPNSLRATATETVRDSRASPSWQVSRKLSPVERARVLA
jgi:hypothetical protein